MTENGKRRTRLKRVDLFALFGAALIVMEALRLRPESPSEIIIFAGLALMGVPFLSRLDTKMNGKNGGPSE